MRATPAKTLLIAATVLGGLLAGVAVDRSVVQLPAWERVGPSAWAEFTRAADLSRGLICYPLQGIGALACTVGAAIVASLNRASPRSAFVPLYAAAVLAFAALLVTRYRVAPEMLTLNHLGADENALRQAFAGIRTWWNVKALLHALTFLANVWALCVIGKRT